LPTADPEELRIRLRRSRRAAGPAVSHNSQFGPRNGPRISSVQRDAIYRQIVDRLDQAGNLALLVEQGDLGAVRRLAREVTDDLQLVLDGLGWGENSNGGDVMLDFPSEQLRRTFARLRERAVEHREASIQAARAPYGRAVIVIETCDHVLAVVGGNAQGTTG
jgi:hypothetical protein